ncbi:MAG: LysM peptidoglycan-binding domain-containing protein [Flavobacteriaceae bacterium]|nr:LysM peptidoglycan-binding domain-containing protein [Flavobacteriaceae bacterium]
MRNTTRFLITIFIVSFLTSCSSTKKTVSKNSKKEISLSKEQILFNKSDQIFDDFKSKNGNRLNIYTLEYVNRYKHIAIEDMVEFKIPASITLAQGVLESGSGRSELSRKSNNHFGIKCHKGWKGKKVRYDDDKKRECFRKYQHPEESFDDHSTFLTTRSRYASLFELKPDNYKGWSKGLKKAGYATDRKYPSKLIKIIEDYHLYEYDDLVLNKNKKSRHKKEVRSSKKSNNFVVVSQGDTLYSISKNNNLTVNQLKEINNLKSNEINIGQKLFLSK